MKPITKKLLYLAIASQLSLGAVGTLAESIDIKSQTLATALKDLGRQTDLQLMFSNQDLTDVKIKGITGDMSAEHALKLLLTGTDLAYEYTAANTVVVKKSNAVASGEAAAKKEWTIQEIIVTAQKRKQNVQDVPIAITTLSSQKLDILSSGGNDIRFLSARVPSLVAESSLGRTYPRFYIRGFGNTDFRSNASQPVEMVYDEVILSSSLLKGFPIFDLDRIEVLKGPQGTLFGRNTPAGIIKLDSVKPSHETDGYAKVGYGTYGQFNLEGAVGGSLIEDVLSARVSLLKQSREDYVDNLFTGDDDSLGGYDDFAGRVQLDWTPNDDLSVLLNVHHRDLDGTSQPFMANIIEQGSNDLVSGFKRDEVAMDGQNSQTLSQTGSVLKVEYDLGSLTLTSVTGYEEMTMFSRGDVDGGFGASWMPDMGPGFIPFSAESAGDVDIEQFTQEVRLSSNGWDTVNFQAGLFFFDENLNNKDFAYDSLSGGTIFGITDTDQKTQTLGVFGSIDYAINDSLNVTAGIRYSSDEKDYATQPIMSPAGATATRTESTDESAVSWDLSATYALNEDVNLYARIAKGFRAPSIQGDVMWGDFVTAVDSEEIISYEAGVKSTLMENRLRLNLAAFYYDVDGQQLTAVGGGSNIIKLINADKTVGYGFETDIEFAATENLLITAGASYNYTELQDVDLGVAACGAPCTMKDPVVNDIAMIDGNRLPQAPEWIGNITLRYGVPVGDAGEIYFYTDWAYKSDTNLTLYEAVEFRSDAMLEGGVRLGYIHNDGQFELALYGRNITDKETVTGVLDFNNLTGIVNEPRIWGVEFSRDF